MKLNPNILEYDENAPEPMFDLNICTKTMEDLGIISDFVPKEVTIDPIKPPMQTIKIIQNPKRRFQIYNNVYYNEPIVIEEMSQRTIQMLDAKYEKKSSTSCER